MRHLTHAQLAIAGAVTVTMLAIATGAAAADGIRPDDRAMHGPGAVAVAAAQDDVVVRPDDRAMHGPGAVAVVQDGIVARPGDPGTIPYLSHGTGVDQTLFGRLLDYGTITVTGTGGTKEQFPRIATPLEFDLVFA